MQAPNMQSQCLDIVKTMTAVFTGNGPLICVFTQMLHVVSCYTDFLAAELTGRVWLLHTMLLEEYQREMFVLFVPFSLLFR